MAVEQRPLGLRYSTAIAYVAIAIVARWLMNPVLRDNLPFLTLFPAVAFTVWYGGPGPGAVAAILGYVLAEWLFIAPAGDIGAIRFGNVAAFAGYFASTGAVILFGEMAHRARRAAERSAAEASERGEWFRTTLASIGDGVITTDTEGRVTLLNPIAERLTGWPMSEARGAPVETVLQIVDEDTRRPTPNPAMRALREGAVVALPHRTILIARDGTEHPIDDSAAPILDAAGAVTGVAMIFREVSERRLLESLQRGMHNQLRQQVLERTAALRQSEEMLRLLVEGTRDYAIYMLDPAGRVTSWNPGAQLMTGFEAADAVGRHVSFSYTPEDVRGGRVERELGIARSEGTLEDEGWRLRRDGSRFWARVALTALHDETGGLRGFSIITRDETERKQAEEAARRLLEERAARREAERSAAEIRTQREQLRVTLRSIGDAVITTDAAGAITMINAAAEELTGWMQDEAAGRPLAEVFDIRDEITGRPADNPAIHVLRDGVTVALSNHTILVSKTGETHPIDDSAAPIRQPSGEIAGVVLVFRDVTARRLAERSLRESEARKAAFLDTALDAIITMDAQGRVVEFNRGAEKMLGRTQADAVGQDLADLIIPEHLRARHRSGLARYLDTGEGPVLDRLVEMAARRADGTELPVEMVITRLPVDGPPLFTAHMRDITERAKAERRRRARLAVTQILARALSLADAAPAILQSLGDNLGWQAGALWLMDPRDRVLRCDTFWRDASARLAHFEPATLEQAFAPGTGLPGRVWVSGTPAWIPNVSQDRNFPRGVAAAKDGLHSAFGFPIGHGTERFGVIEFFSAEIREPDPDLVEMVATLGGQVGQFLERRRAEQMAYFLADASASLAALVDDEGALQKMARLVVPVFADWCTVDLLGAENSLTRVAVAHVEPAKADLVRELHRRLPPDPSAATGIWQIIRSGRSELVSEITEENLRATVPDPGALRLLRKLGLRSYIGVPLKVRGKTVGVITLITAESRRRYDKADLAVAEDLAHRVGVAMENARLYTELREADQRKDEFLAILSHELRNPLAPLRSALELVKRRDLDPTATDHAVMTMERQLAQLMRLVDDLLDLRRLTRTAPDLRKAHVELSSVIGNAVETSRPLIEQRGHELAVALPVEPIVVDADATRLAQVFGNLLNNAAKYTDPGGRIWLSAVLDGAWVVVTVRDTGIGIPSAMLPTIFEMFTQLDRSLERSGGLGIGLTLARRLVDMHGGTIDVKSGGLGHGSQFDVRLPVVEHARVAPPAPTDIVDGPPALVRRRILVVDDNRDAASSLAMILDLMGHETRTAFDGPAGLAAAEEFRPGVILLDLGLPGMNGYDVCRRIRGELWGRNAVVIAVTGWGQDQDKRRSRDAGFNFHFVKPVDAADIERVLGALPAPAVPE